MRSRATGSDKISPRCVPRRSTMAKCSRSAPPQHLAVAGLRPDALLARLAVAIFSRGAFPGVLPWQDSAAVRSRASIRGKFCAPCIPKAASDGKRQFAARFSRHASENGLALAGYARHASEKPRKPPFGNAPREDLARKGPFSLHGPFESRTARESCHRSAHERKGSGRKCLRFVKTEPKRQKMSPKVLTSF